MIKILGIPPTRRLAHFWSALFIHSDSIWPVGHDLADLKIDPVTDVGAFGCRGPRCHHDT